GQLLVTGPVVNLAARLQAAAQPGQVLVGQTTSILTSANVSYARRRRVRAKGFDSSLDAFAVEDLTARSARRTIPFVGLAGDVAGVRSGDTPDVVRERLVELAGRVSDARASARTAQRLALLFGPAESRDETAFVPEVQAGFISVIDGLSRDHPVLVIFEDAHTLKAQMLDLIQLLSVRGAGSRRALIVVLARTELLEQRPTWGSSSSNSV